VVNRSGYFRLNSSITRCEDEPIDRDFTAGIRQGPSPKQALQCPQGPAMVSPKCCAKVPA
jgi:hypothetical protein